MTIFLGSRYQTATILAVADANQVLQRVAFRGPSPLPPLRRSTVYTTVQGDRMEHLAMQFYGRPDYWWVIADANSGVMLPDPVPPGTVLVIPDGLDIR